MSRYYTFNDPEQKAKAEGGSKAKASFSKGYQRQTEETRRAAIVGCSQSNRKHIPITLAKVWPKE